MLMKFILTKILRTGFVILSTLTPQKSPKNTDNKQNENNQKSKKKTKKHLPHPNQRKNVYTNPNMQRPYVDFAKIQTVGCK